VAVLVDLERVSVLAADRLILSDLSLTVHDGDRIGIVGINGTGKSTLLRVMTGEITPDSGVVRRGRGVRLASLTQEPSLPNQRVREIVGDSWEALAAIDRLSMTAALDLPATSLSGGQAKRVALAQVVATESELLILDEPTNHLDLAGISWLEQWLANYRGGLVIVSHDRYLLDRVTTKMLELDRGASFLHHGGYGSYLEAKARRDELAQAAEATRRNLAKTELAWLRRGAKARTRKPQARIDAALALIEGRPDAPARPGDLELISAMPRLGRQVVDLDAVSVVVDGTKTVLNNVSRQVGQAERIGIVGLNGVGKSTLLDCISGRRTPTSGTVTLGTTVVLGYYDQHGTDLDPTIRVREVVAGPHRPPGSPEDLALMQRFWFTGNLPFTQVRDLSGGERRRLQLLALLATQPNVLLLDEPTNDLDLETLRTLEEFLDTWPGTAFIVSHDRAFLERTCEVLLAISPDGSLRELSGSIDNWISTVTASPSVAATATPSSSTTSPSPSPNKRLRELEKTMQRLERSYQKLSEQLVATTDRDEARIRGDELKRIRRELDEAELEWLELATT
jgi:ATP-binding cassette subfamily F protein uup